MSEAHRIDLENYDMEQENEFAAECERMAIANTIAALPKDSILLPVKSYPNSDLLGQTMDCEGLQLASVAVKDLLAEATALREQVEKLTKERDAYAAMIAEAGYIQFSNGSTIIRPCSQPQGVQCWHDDDDTIYHSALDAFAALANDQLPDIGKLIDSETGE